MMEAGCLKFPLNKGGSAVGAGVVLMSAGKPDGQPPGARRAAPFVKGECCPLLTR